MRMLCAPPCHARGDAVYHPLRTETATHAQGVNTKTASDAPLLHCWHCCEALPDRPPGEDERHFAAPASVDDAGRYEVFGVFCSLECGKGHVLEADTYNRAMRICLFARMAREVYGVDDVKAAPPRITLQKFGGPYSLEAFRRNAPRRVAVVTPPFVTHHMFVEEVTDHSGSCVTTEHRGDTTESAESVSDHRDLNKKRDDDDDFSETPKRCVYDEFVAAQSSRAVAPPLSKSATHEARPSQSGPSRKARPPADSQGGETLSRFARRRNSNVSDDPA
jgi:hypothetical protein